LVFMGRQLGVEREAIVGAAVPEVVHSATKRQSESPS